MYERQISLIGKESQLNLNKKTITILGLGALGSNSANLLARAGINLKLIDFDTIDETNLLSQSLYNYNDLKKNKAETAYKKLKEINPLISINFINAIIDDSNLELLKSDLVLDCTDNISTRLLINEYCYKNKIPLVHSAVIGYKGVIYNSLDNQPCLSCIYKSFSNEEKCETFGVLNTIVSLISSIASNEVIKILLKENYEKALLRIDIKNNEIEKIITKKDKNCICCGLGESISFKTYKLCKNETSFIITPLKKIQINESNLKNFKIKEKTNNSFLVSYKNQDLIIYKNGKIIGNNFKKDIINLIYENG